MKFIYKHSYEKINIKENIKEISFFKNFYVFQSLMNFNIKVYTGKTFIFFKKSDILLKYFFFLKDCISFKKRGANIHPISEKKLKEKKSQKKKKK